MKQVPAHKSSIACKVIFLLFFTGSGLYPYAQETYRENIYKKAIPSRGTSRDKAALIFVSGLLTGALVTASIVFIKRKRVQSKQAGDEVIHEVINTTLRHQLETERVINYFASSMVGKLTVDDMLWDIARNCISTLDFEDCVIYLKDEERDVLVQKAAWGPKTTEENKILNPIEIPVGSGIVGAVAKYGRTEMIPDTTKDSRYIIDDMLRQSELAVPIAMNGKVIGVIDSEHSEKNFYTQRHIQILTTIASLCADKIEIVKAEQQVRERQIELINLNRDMATYQLTALRAQMSPHFIFNALNSIQQYILSGDVHEANRYLSKFSRLQREVLHHCDLNFISLEKELEMLELYLELEKLRFNNNFESCISVDEGIDSNEVKIPAMMLQPFIENAIWHGLMPKASHRKVKIDFTLHSEELLNCVISDNGIGRAAAAEKNMSSTNISYKSKGMSLVLERMKILQQQYHHPFQAEVSDILDGNGNVGGTRVNLLLYIGK